MRDLEKAREKVRSKIHEKNEKLSIKPKAPDSGTLKPGQLRKGDAVKVLSMGLRGIVNSLPDRKGNLFVQCGIIRSQVHISDLALIQEDTFPAAYRHRQNKNVQIRFRIHGNQPVGQDG